MDQPNPQGVRVEAVHALMRFAFDELGCVHLEMMDRNLAEEDVRNWVWITIYLWI